MFIDRINQVISGDELVVRVKDDRVGLKGDNGSERLSRKGIEETDQGIALVVFKENGNGHFKEGDRRMRLRLPE